VVYRICALNHEGWIVERHDLPLANDEDAMKMAASLLPPRAGKIEVRRGATVLTTFPAG
jgi:hypothetical protein